GEHFEAMVLDSWSASERSRGRSGSAIRGRVLRALAEPDVRVRLLFQFSPHFVDTLLRRTSRDSAATLEVAIRALDVVSESARGRGALIRQMSDVALAAASADRRLTPRELVGAAWRALAPVEQHTRAIADALARRWP